MIGAVATVIVLFAATYLVMKALKVACNVFVWIIAFFIVMAILAALSRGPA